MCLSVLPALLPQVLLGFYRIPNSAAEPLVRPVCLSWVCCLLACCACCRASWPDDPAARLKRVDLAAQLLHASAISPCRSSRFVAVQELVVNPQGLEERSRVSSQPYVAARQHAQPQPCGCPAAGTHPTLLPLFSVRKGHTSKRRSFATCLPARSCVCGTVATTAASWSRCASPSGQRGRRALPRIPAPAAAAPAALCRLRPAARRRTLGERLGPAGWHAIACHQLSSAAQLMPLGDRVRVEPLLSRGCAACMHACMRSAMLAAEAVHRPHTPATLFDSVPDQPYDPWRHVCLT